MYGRLKVNSNIWTHTLKPPPKNWLETNKFYFKGFMEPRGIEPLTS